MAAEQKTEKSREWIDVHSTTSSLPGLIGFIEATLRKFRIVAYILALIPIYLLASLCAGISLVPSIFLVKYLWIHTQGWPEVFHFAAVGIGIFAGFLLYGFTLIFVVPFVNFILPFRVKPWRGSYFSLHAIPWFVHNALTYLVRYTFLEFITPTPFNLLFYRLMGMKIGKNVFLNTTRISDPALITIEDNVTIGGSATIIAHSAVAGFLIIAPVKIEKGVTVGLGATIMGDVVIGTGSKIAPGEVVLPKSRISESLKEEQSEALPDNDNVNTQAP